MSERDKMRVLASNSSLDRITRRKFLASTIAVGIGTGIGVSGCGGSSSSGTGKGDLGNKLNMYSWGEYDDPKVLKRFTRKFGPEIQVDGYSSNEEMIAKLTAAKGTSGFDIVVPTGNFIPQMAKNGLLEELDLSAIPNRSKIEGAFLDQPWDPGNKYSLCKDWGTTVYMYDTTKISRKLTSWADFLDAAQNEASGTTTVLGDPKEVVGIALFAQGADYNTTNEDDLNAAEQTLVNQLAPHIKAFESYPGANIIPQSGAALVQCWNGEARQGLLASSKPDKWEWVMPSEGANLWMDNWSIVKGAPHVDEAHAFINYVLKPENSLKELAFHGYNTGAKGIEQAAEDQGIKLLELMFFSKEDVANFVPAELNNAQQRIVDIFGKMKAKAGA